MVKRQNLRMMNWLKKSNVLQKSTSPYPSPQGEGIILVIDINLSSDHWESEYNAHFQKSSAYPLVDQANHNDANH